MNDSFKTPAELVGMLSEYEDAETAARVYAEASAIEEAYGQVKEAAKDMAMALLPKGAKINIGPASAGWTRPKTTWVLDESAWDRARQEKKELAALAANYEAAKAAYEAAEVALNEAQKHYQKEETPPSRFFIKINRPAKTE